MNTVNAYPGNPPRRLTAEFRKYARRRTRSTLKFIIVPIIMFTVFGSSAVIADIMILSDIIFNTFGGRWHPGFIIFAISTNTIIIAYMIYAIIQIRKTYRRYCFVLMNGGITKASIKEIGLDWQMQMNDTPRSIIDMQIGEKTIRIKTFSPDILNFCSEGSEMPVIWHKDMPEIIIPVKSLVPQPKEPEPETFSI